MINDVEERGVNGEKYVTGTKMVIIGASATESSNTPRTIPFNNVVKNDLIGEVVASSTGAISISNNVKNKYNFLDIIACVSPNITPTETGRIVLRIYNGNQTNVYPNNLAYTAPSVSSSGYSNMIQWSGTTSELIGDITIAFHPSFATGSNDKLDGTRLVLKFYN